MTGVRERATDRGSATIELAVLAPALLALLGLVILAGRISVAGSAVEQAAASAARAASIARDARAAQSAAERTARDSLRDQGVTCQPLTSSVDTRGFAVALGSPSSVTVTVRCAVPLSDVSVPGLPGQRMVTAAMTSPIDRFRGAIMIVGPYNRLTSWRAPGDPSERGAVTLFLAIAMVGLLALAGLVVDGGAKVRAVQRADRLAAEAARAGGQAIDLAGVLEGSDVRVDRRPALVAAESYLLAAGVEGSARVIDGGRGISVTTTTSAPTVFLGLIGVPQFTVRGRAEVALIHSVRGARP